MTILNNLEDFCNQTSLHGWSYLTRESSILGKCFWVTAVTFGLIASLGLIIINYMDYINLPPITYIESKTAPLSDVPFPTLTLTPLNQIQKSFWAKINATDKDDWKFLTRIFSSGIPLNTADRYAKMEEELLKKYEARLKNVFNWTADTNFIHISAMNCSDMLLRVKFGKSAFKTFFDGDSWRSDFGKGCIIQPFLHFHYNETKDSNSPYFENKYWEMAYESPGMESKSGIQNGLSILIDMEAFDYGDYRPTYTGTYVSIDSATTQPRLSENSLLIQNGKGIQIEVKPTMTTTSEAALSFYKPESRDCYTSDEFQLAQFGFRYSHKNCVYEAAYQATLEKCYCTPSYAYTNNMTKMCAGSKIKCAQNVLHGHSELGIAQEALDTNGIKKKCMKSCHDIEYNMNVHSSADYPAARTFLLKKQSCHIFQKIIRICRDPWKKISFEDEYKTLSCEELIYLHEYGPKICENITSMGSKLVKKFPKVYDLVLKYTKDNIANLKLYISDPYYTKIVRDVRLTPTAFIGNTGGLIGLCIGMSFISVIEIIFHCMSLAKKLISSHTKFKCHREG